MLTTNVLQRTFQISFAGDCGTAFTIDIEKRQYLVTARHVVENFGGGVLDIYHDSEWKKTNFELVGIGEGDVDIAVLAPKFQLSPTHTLEATSAHLTLGQTVYFLGFPYGLQQEMTAQMNRKFPFPLVKSGVVSAIDFGDNVSTMLLDGHNNPGFSGGPVVYIPPNRPASEENLYRVCGVVSAYPTYPEPVFDSNGDETGQFIKNNPGLVIAHNIKHARELIEVNPVGFELSTDS